jgi:hypothetical protein
VPDRLTADEVAFTRHSVHRLSVDADYQRCRKLRLTGSEAQTALFPSSDGNSTLMRESHMTSYFMSCSGHLFS